VTSEASPVGRVIAMLAAGTGEWLAQLVDSTPVRRLGLSIDVDRIEPEWTAFLLSAAVRGIVAALGFGEASRTAVDRVEWLLSMVPLASSQVDPDTGVRGLPEPIRSERLARLRLRRDEYAAAALEGGASAATRVPARVGAIGALRLFGLENPPPDVVEVLGDMYEAIAEGVVDLLREAET